MRHDVAALFCNCFVGSVRERYMGVVRRIGVLVGLPLSLGVDSVSLWIVDELRRCRLGLDARRKLVWREQHGCIRNAEWWWQRLCSSAAPGSGWSVPTWIPADHPGTAGPEQRGAQYRHSTWSTRSPMDSWSWERT